MFALLLARLFFLQVINNDKYTLLSDKNRTYITYSAAPRGTIFDRNKKILATSRLSYCAAIDLSRYTSSDWARMCDTLGLNKDTPPSAYIDKQIRAVGPTSIIPVKDHLSWNEILDVETLSSQGVGVVVVPKIVRVYPYGAACCHCVGYVTQPNSSDIARNANLKVLDASIGKMGIERAFDASLQGQIGMRRVEVNAMRHMVRVMDEQPPVKGQDVTLAIDVDLQTDVIDIMKDVRCGVVMVMDIRTGEILASVSVPTFDPSLFSKAISKQEWQGLLGNQDLPLINRAVAGVYAPGSAFKPIVALAALDRGVVSSKTRFDCYGYYDVNKDRFHCHRWRTGGHGELDIVKAIEQSCDVFFYNIAVKIGASAIIDVARDFGFGELTNVGLLEEKRGQVPPAKKVWQKQDIGMAINLAIGQGNLTATPLQLLRMTAMLASGRRVEPVLVACVGAGEGAEAGEGRADPADAADGGVAGNVGGGAANGRATDGGVEEGGGLNPVDGAKNAANAEPGIPNVNEGNAQNSRDPSTSSQQRDPSSSSQQQRDLSSSSQQQRDLSYSGAALEIVRSGMLSVVEHGTASRACKSAFINGTQGELVRRWFEADDGCGGRAGGRPGSRPEGRPVRKLSLAGKTGSTQVCRITKDERVAGRLIERPYHLKDHALFVGYAPADNPRFAVVVVVEHGESGGRVAAPIGAQALVAAIARAAANFH
ncbi:MAG: hypothetical protein LBR89_02765 [Holosporales bacterium]|nr:hypothetical protein [Holosporales bacterium]